jgi:hypothetical protein
MASTVTIVAVCHPYPSRIAGICQRFMACAVCNGVSRGGTVGRVRGEFDRLAICVAAHIAYLLR